MKNLVLLGATGSIGESTLKVAEAHPDRLRIVAVAGNRRWQELSVIARRHQVMHVGLFCEKACLEARHSGAFLPGTSFYAGLDGLCQLSCLPEAHTLVAAIVGVTSLKPTLCAIEAGKEIALASKEILVMAGQFVMEAARLHNTRILPLDSEHNAIFQCLQGERPCDIGKIILTASGGPFRDYTHERMQTITRADALRHPNWDMGPKITIDSASMANKGLEVIEARWLFGLNRSQIDVVVHPQSIVHSMVQFVDGSIIAQLSPPHMCFAIQHALLYPERDTGCVPTLDFSKAFQLDFRAPDYSRFPCLRLAMECLDAGGVAPAVFNAANETAVSAFLEDRIGFLDIPKVIEHALNQVPALDPVALSEVLSADLEARRIAGEACHVR